MIITVTIDGSTILSDISDTISYKEKAVTDAINNTTAEYNKDAIGFSMDGSKTYSKEE